MKEILIIALTNSVTQCGQCIRLDVESDGGQVTLHFTVLYSVTGLGVDDAFVIVQAWNRLTPAERTLPLHEQAGHALKHAGVSITVTSVTDIVAFGIGATTVS